MGQEIVKQESLLEPGGRSRLWFYDDIIQVLEDNTGTDKIQFILLDAGKHQVQWRGDELKKMTNLRVLIIKDVDFSQSPRYLPNNLRVLDWERYPSSFLPFEFQPRKLAILNLRSSNFRWDEALDKAPKRWENIKMISLKGCQYLKQVPDLSIVPNLTDLDLDYCYNLTEIHDSVGSHDKLQIISAHYCKKLVSFPHFRKLKSLKQLRLTRCENLQYFPEVLGKGEKLSVIEIRNSAIEELPCSIQNITGLVRLCASHCPRLRKLPSCILRLPKFNALFIGGCIIHFFKVQRKGQEQLVSYTERVSLRNCKFLDGFLPNLLDSLLGMTRLELCGSNLTILPESIQACKRLKELYLDNCKQLQEIKVIPPNIETISAINCTSLVPSLLKLLSNLDMHCCSGRKFTFPGTSISEWVHHYVQKDTLPGTSISDWVQKAYLSFWFRNEFPNCALFAMVGPNDHAVKCRVYINHHELNTGYFESCEKLASESCEKDTEHIYLYDRPVLNNMEYPQERDQWNRVSYEFKSHRELYIEGIGIYIYNQARIGKDILFTNPNLNPNPESS